MSMNRLLIIICVLVIITAAHPKLSGLDPAQRVEHRVNIGDFATRVAQHAERSPGVDAIDGRQHAVAQAPAPADRAGAQDTLRHRRAQYRRRRLPRLSARPSVRTRPPSAIRQTFLARAPGKAHRPDQAASVFTPVVQQLFRPKHGRQLPELTLARARFVGLRESHGHGR